MEPSKIQDTITYVAGPVDPRCAWWCFKLKDLTVDHLENKPLERDFLKRGADLELEHGEMLIDSEANHHRHNRGYFVQLGVAVIDRVYWIVPSMAIKQHIKVSGGKHLMKGSGDVVAVLRMAMWIKEQPDLKSSVKKLQSLEDKDKVTYA